MPIHVEREAHNRQANMRVIFLVTLLSLLSGCATKPYAIISAVENSSSGSNEIYVVSHGWHTGLVLPANKIQSLLPKLKTRFGETPNIELGWGDKGFYQAEEITVGLAFRALFWSSGSIIHAVAVPNNVDAFFSNSKVGKLCLSDSEYVSLLDFISSSFNKNQQGEIIELQNGLYGDSQFYEGVGNYHLLNTCNSWTAKGLKSAGMDISPVFSLTASSVMRFVQAQKQTCPNNINHAR